MFELARPFLLALAIGVQAGGMGSTKITLTTGEGEVVGWVKANATAGGSTKLSTELDLTVLEWVDEKVTVRFNVWSKDGGSYTETVEADVSKKGIARAKATLRSMPPESCPRPARSASVGVAPSPISLTPIGTAGFDSWHSRQALRLGISCSRSSPSIDTGTSVSTAMSIREAVSPASSQNRARAPGRPSRPATGCESGRRAAAATAIRRTATRP